ncbi:uncharacterized protein B4U79_03071, partial [Dinothrombium tinctorium]
MNVMAFDVYQVFRRRTRRENSTKIAIKYSLYAWLVPSFIVLIALCNEFLLPTNDYQPLYGIKMCWISQRMALLIFFAIPLMLILAMNIIFFILTLIILIKLKKATQMVNEKKENKIRFKLYLKIFVLMGLTWCFAFIASFNGVSFLWYPFIVLNGLQGVFIFMSFTFKRKTFQQLKEVISKQKTTGSFVAQEATTSI